MVACSECHLRVDGDVEACLLQTFVERCLDCTFAVHYDRGELALPYSVPVYRRHEVGVEVDIESHALDSAQNDFKFMSIIKFLLYVAFEIRVVHSE